MNYKLLESLEELQNGEEYDSFGRLRPTAYAYNKAKEFITLIPEHLKAFLSTDSEGGVRIDFVKNQYSLVLVIGNNPDSKSYCYDNFIEPTSNPVEEFISSLEKYEKI